MRAFGCSSVAHQESRIFGLDGRPASVAGSLVMFFLSLFIVFIRDDANTIPFYVFSWEPSSYGATKAAPCSDFCLFR